MATKHTIAQAKYDKEHRRTYGIRLHNEIDQDIISRLSVAPSMQGYIKELIRQDIKANPDRFKTVPDSAPDSDK